jgi:dienelactone hydrolase
LICLACLPGLANAQPYVSMPASFAQHGGGTTLSAMIYAPNVAAGSFPIISMLPGGGAPISSVEWAATRLAASGYVVVITQPQFGGSPASYNLAARSGIDFLSSTANPFLAITDTTKVGAAGWSLGARALSRTQEEDLRVQAIVAWDNLARSESGDLGSPSGPMTPNPLRTPRVPALGQASDTNPNQSVDPNAKINAFQWWRQHNVPSMQVVFRDTNHFFWSGAASSSANHDLSHYYTQAWFDRWLKNDAAATDRLLSASVLNRPIGDILSDSFTSAAYLDGNDINPLVSIPEPRFMGLLAAAALGLYTNRRSSWCRRPVK